MWGNDGCILFYDYFHFSSAEMTADSELAERKIKVYIEMMMDKLFATLKNDV